MQKRSTRGGSKSPAIQPTVVAVLQPKKSPVAPPVFRLPTIPKVLQAKPVNATLQVRKPNLPAPAQHAQSVLQRTTSNSPHPRNSPVAPPVYRPQQRLIVLQPAIRSARPLSSSIQRMDGDGEENYKINENGYGLSVSMIDALETLIHKYDVALDRDVGRGQSDKDSSINNIAVGAAALCQYVNSLDRVTKKSLENIQHPGSRRTGGSKWQTRSFLEIIGEIAKGEQCHNDIAEALRECLGTLK